MFRRVEPHFQLPPSQLDALRAVGVQASYGFHGNTVMPFLADGSLNQRVVVLDVVDADYTAATAFTDRFEPGRDILAHEGVGKTNGPHGTGRLFGMFGRITRNTPGVTTADTARLAAAAEVVPDPGSAEYNALASTWDSLAELRAVDPLLYAVGHAGMRGVQLWNADATEKQLDRFARDWFWLLGPPTEGKRYERYCKGPEQKFRNNRALEHLGAAALSLDDSKAQLGYIAGGAHKASMDATLAKQGIPLTSELFSPDWQQRKQTTEIAGLPPSLPSMP